MIASESESTWKFAEEKMPVIEEHGIQKKGGAAEMPPSPSSKKEGAGNSAGWRGEKCDWKIAI